MSVQASVDKLKARFGDTVLETSEFRGETTVVSARVLTKIDAEQVHIG